MVINSFQDMRIFTMAVYKSDTLVIVDVAVGNDGQSKFETRITLSTTIAKILMATDSILLVDDQVMRVKAQTVEHVLQDYRPHYFVDYHRRDGSKCTWEYVSSDTFMLQG